MTNKEKYIEFCNKENNLPIFHQYWWLDAVCGENNWDVILYEKGGHIWGSMPYYKIKKYLFKMILMPKLTQFMGPYIKFPKNQKYYKKLSWEKEIMEYFIKNLPQVDFFYQNFHFSITNWLPFYWKGFKQTTRYTYVIDRNLDIENLSKNFETDVRRRIRKAIKNGVRVIESENVRKFYELNKMTFERQGLSIPYSYELVKKIYDYCKKHNSVKIYFAIDNQNNIIAGSFLVYDMNTVYYLMGGIDPERKDIGGMDLVLHESIQFALESKRDFDFEGSMIESIEKYFRSYGAIQKSYFQITKAKNKFINTLFCIVKG